MLKQPNQWCSSGSRTAAFIAVAASVSLASAQPVLFVDDDATPGGSGATWATAFTHLQDALAAAAGSAGAVTEIRVAGGVYTPDTSAANPAGTGARTATFNLVKNVTVKGGYAGSLAPNGDDRDTSAFESVLSGEIGVAGAADNSYHVLRAFSVGGPVVLDGLTVADGNANLLSSSDNKRGGGLYLILGEGTVTDCVFTNNYGVDGGAIHANLGTLSVNGTSFVGNSAKFGGGIYQTSTGITVTGSTFTGNSASSTGGAIRRTGGSGITVNISDTVFDGNSAQQGGAIDLFANTPGVSIERSVFSYNVANTISGAISNFSEGMSADNCLFVGNSAGTLAGAIGVNFNNSGQPGPEVTNCTVVNNTAATGGGIYSLGSAGATSVTNSILWGNSDNGGSDETAQLDLSAITNPATTNADSNVIMSLVGGGQYDSGTNTANSGGDPLFADESMDDFRLSIASPAVDTGDNAASTSLLDLDGLARIVDGDFDNTPTVDRGAYEFVSTDSDGDGLDDIIEIGLGTDPLLPDTDADGLTDGEEVNTYGTSPLLADTDGDTLSDGTEIMLQAFGCPDPLVADTDMDGLDDGQEIALGLDACNNADYDNDGLMDVQEILDFLTDPFNPDSDGDGLLDGTEVDIAEGTGCPDPLAFDSDFDGISDGDEITLDTSPCLVDTDGDGVSDLDDPTPTVPGVTSGFLEDATRDAATAVEAINLSVFSGPNNNANRGRQNSLSTRLQQAANSIAKGKTNSALSKLANVLERVDGEANPGDWIDAGPEQEALEAEIELLIALLTI